MALIRRASHAGSWYSDNGKETFVKNVLYFSFIARPCRFCLFNKVSMDEFVRNVNIANSNFKQFINLFLQNKNRLLIIECTVIQKS